MLPRRDRLRSIYVDHPRPGELEPAGTNSVEWLDAFLPISDSGTDVELFVDLRDGDLNGCIGQFDGEMNGFNAPFWTSTTQMLAEVADALTLGQPVLQAYANLGPPGSRLSPRLPHLEDGRLSWTIAGW
jgi:hypothetical protein